MTPPLTDEEYLRWEQRVDRLVHADGAEPALAFIRGSLASRDDRRMHMKEAFVLMTLGRSEEGAVILTGLLEQRPDDTELHGLLGRVLLNGPSPAAALPHLEIAATDERWRKQAKLNIASVVRRVEGAEPARVRLEELLREHPGDPDVLARVVPLYSQMSRREEALALAQEAGRRHPEHADLQGELGVLMLELERYQEAVDLLGKAVELEPEDPWWHIRAAEAQVRQEDFPSAVRVLKGALRHHPHDPDILFRLGLYSAAAGNDDALAYAQRAVDVDPDIGESWAGKAYALARQGRHSEAAAALREGLKHPPVSESMLNILRGEGVLP